MNFSFDRTYTVKGQTCRYLGDNVFKTFETLDRSKVIQLTDDDARLVKETDKVLEVKLEDVVTKPMTQDLPQGHYVQPAIIAESFETKEKAVEVPPTKTAPETGKVSSKVA